ncbi:hypothetical protein BGZ46_000857 [Entomortierella lignicola]|nr:hypothetical protein BGZ46_000857 [Entomortierella lignicola]
MSTTAVSDESSIQLQQDDAILSQPMDIDQETQESLKKDDTKGEHDSSRSGGDEKDHSDAKEEMHKDSNTTQSGPLPHSKDNASNKKSEPKQQSHEQKQEPSQNDLKAETVTQEKAQGDVKMDHDGPITSSEDAQGDIDQEMSQQQSVTSNSHPPSPKADPSSSIAPQADSKVEPDHLQPQSSSPTQKRAAEDTPQDTPIAKGQRTKREITKKAPKVYPPRKPRVRPVSVEPLTMTIRTDSALSTLASAAAAIKDHQGSLSALSVPPLSPSTEASQASKTTKATQVAPQAPQASQAEQDPQAPQDTKAPKSPQSPQDTSPASGASSTPPDSTASATSTTSRTPGRSPPKGNSSQDTSGYRCELCPGERFGRVHDLKRHQISKHNEMTWPCDFCHRPFVRRDALLRHYSVKAARRDGVHPTDQEENRLQEAKARAKLLS